MKKPKISVVIPAYNCEKYIKKCLDSILGQSFQDFEILVINDGSKDRTGEIAKRYEAKDRRVRYIEQENMGAGLTRNKAIRIARGEFICFVDSDDYVDEDYLEKLLDEETDVVLSGYRREDEEGRKLLEVRLKNAPWSKFVIPATCAKMYRRQYLLDEKIEYLNHNIGEDPYFNLIAVLSSDRIKIINYAGYVWFYNDKSVSNTVLKDLTRVDIFKFLDSCYDELKRRGLLEKNYEALELFFYRFMIWFLLYASKGQKSDAINQKYDKLFSWLTKRFPNYRKNKLLRGKLPGEEKKTRIAYKTFFYAQRIGLGKALILLYAKV